MPNLPGFDHNEQDERSYRRRNTKLRRKLRRWKLRLFDRTGHRQVVYLEHWARNQAKERASENGGTDEERCPSCGRARNDPAQNDTGTGGGSLCPNAFHRTTEDSTFREDAEIVRRAFEAVAHGSIRAREEGEEALDRILTSYESTKRELDGTKLIRDLAEAALRNAESELESMKRERDDSRSAQVTLRAALNGYRHNATEADDRISQLEKERDEWEFRFEQAVKVGTGSEDRLQARLSRYEEALREMRYRVPESLYDQGDPIAVGQWFVDRAARALSEGSSEGETTTGSEGSHT